MLYQFKLRQIFYYKLMQGLNKNKADIITQLYMQKERGGVKNKGGGVCATWILHKSFDSLVCLLECVGCNYHRCM